MHARMIVGLGNPEASYLNNRHNVGFLLVDHLARCWDGRWENNHSKFASWTAEVKKDGFRWLLVKPRTYMNRSGVAVRKLVDYFSVSVGDLMVCYDDLDLQPGVIRLRPAGSSGGHNGVKSIDSHLGTQSYPRLRLGIGRGEKEVIQHVLSDFTDSEKEQLDRVFDEVERALHTWSRAGLEKAMSLHNGKVSDLG